MYRAYENPRSLENQLKELQEEYHKAVALGADVYELMDIEMEIAELKDRINFAWQDDEADDEEY